MSFVSKSCLYACISTDGSKTILDHLSCEDLDNCQCLCHYSPQDIKDYKQRFAEKCVEERNTFCYRVEDKFGNSLWRYKNGKRRPEKYPIIHLRHPVYHINAAESFGWENIDKHLELISVDNELLISREKHKYCFRYPEQLLLWNTEENWRKIFDKGFKLKKIKANHVLHSTVESIIVR